MRELFPALPAIPYQALLPRDLPAGDPWGWLMAQWLLEAVGLARKILQGGPELTPGLAELARQALYALDIERNRMRAQHPIADLGTRSPLPAEQAALEALESLEPGALGRLYHTHGYAPYATHSAFFYDARMQPVAHPDPVGFEELVGFERQLGLLRRNVERFLRGEPALPTLLYGARGSGKSTAVKALRTHYAARGLRLVEVLSEGLEHLPELLEELRVLPQKFVLYLDDLAFTAEDHRFHRLKALLEGAVYAKPLNVLVIATSNRRNLVAERWADRPEPGSEPSAWDTLQDKLALADRFGLVLTFPPFDQALYLETVAHLLGRPLQEADTQAALRFAQEGRGFSGRTARAFVNWHAGEVPVPVYGVSGSNR